MVRACWEDNDFARLCIEQKWNKIRKGNIVTTSYLFAFSAKPAQMTYS